MNRIKNIWKKVFPFLRNRYLITLLVFIVWVGFFDKNNLMAQLRYRGKLKQLEQTRKFYIDQTENDKKAIYDLMSDPEHLEKFAREKYLMKKANEDIFVLVEPKKNSK